MKELGGRAYMDDWREMVSPERAALIVIDMQNDYTHEQGYYARAGLNLDDIRATVPHIARLTEAARAAGVQVFYSQHTILKGYASDSPLWLSIHAAGGLRSLDQEDFYTVDGTWGHEIYAPIAPRNGDVVLQKFRSNCFIGTSLELLLRSMGKETLVVTGQVTQGCVENTLRMARDLDFYAVMVHDACASTRREFHEATMRTLGSRLPHPSADELAHHWQAIAGAASPA
jgi:nicotinamidase-related amidase